MSTLQLRAADGTTLSAYLVKPEGTPRGFIAFALFSAAFDLEVAPRAS